VEYLSFFELFLLQNMFSFFDVRGHPSPPLLHILFPVGRFGIGWSSEHVNLMILLQQHQPILEPAVTTEN
jgi:hypothetical protein